MYDGCNAGVGTGEDEDDDILKYDDDGGDDDNKPHDDNDAHYVGKDNGRTVEDGVVLMRKLEDQRLQRLFVCASCSLSRLLPSW